MAFKPSLLVPVVGNQAIDYYHARLADLLAEAQTMLHADDNEGLAATVATFREVIAEHFAQEEVIIRGAGFAGADTHSIRHDELRTEIDVVAADLGQVGNVLARFTAVDVLSRILYTHELADDYDYRDSIRDCAADPVQWGGDLCVGVPWIDEQHQILVAMVNEIVLAGRDDVPADTLLGLFKALQKAVRQHFADEEAQLADWGVESAPHRHQHTRLMEQLEAHMASGPEGGIERAGDYLKFWLMDHIRTTDRADFAPARTAETAPPGDPLNRQR